MVFDVMSFFCDIGHFVLFLLINLESWFFVSGEMKPLMVNVCKTSKNFLERQEKGYLNDSYVIREIEEDRK